MINKFIFKVSSFFNRLFEKDETVLLAIGLMLSKQQISYTSTNINDYEFKVFSQFGDDGLIQFLIRNIDIKNETFIEFGVENYLESNTRFLMMNNNWSGFVMDGSKKAMDKLRNRSWFWKYSLTTKNVFITKENINQLISEQKLHNLGLLHIDIDGNDYHILEETDLSVLNPSIIIMEYNSVFGNERPITVPYNKSFYRTNEHYSNLYFGASLPALNYLATKKGYALVCCNNAGNNAYFVRKDLLNDKVKEVTLQEGFKISKFREGRNKDFSLSLLEAEDRYNLIKGMNVLNVETNTIELL